MRGPGFVTLVVSALAGHAYAQPSVTPPQSPAAPAPPPTTQPPPSTRSPENVLCFFGRPYECASVLLLELGARGNADHSVTTGDFGLLIHDGLNAYGGTIGLVDVSDASDPAVLYAARYRRYLGTWGLSGDVSVGYAGGPTLEVALGWGDVLAVTAGVNQYEQADGDQNVVAGVGLRLGSVTIGGLLYVAALIGTSGR